MGWIRKKLIGFDPNDASDVDKLATEYLKTSTKIHSDTLKAAQKINQANLLSMQQRQLRDALVSGMNPDDEEDYEDEDEEGDEFEEGQGLTDKIINSAVKNLFGNQAAQSSPTASLPSENPAPSDLRARAGEVLKNMSDRQLEALAKKGFI